MEGQLPLSTIDLDALIEIVKTSVLLVINQLNDLSFSWGDFVFTFWEFLLVAFIFSVLCFALLKSRGSDDDD